MSNVLFVVALLGVGGLLAYVRARLRRTEHRRRARPVPCGRCGEIAADRNLVHGLCIPCLARRIIRRCAECEQPLPAGHPADWPSCTSCMAPHVIAIYRTSTGKRIDLDAPGALDAQSEAALTQLLRGVPRAWDRF